MEFHSLIASLNLNSLSSAKAWQFDADPLEIVQDSYFKSTPLLTLYSFRKAHSQSAVLQGILWSKQERCASCGKASFS